MNRSYTVWVLGLVTLAVFAYFYYLEISWLKQQHKNELAFGNVFKESMQRVEVRRGNAFYVLVNSEPVRKDRYHPDPVISDRANLAKWTVKSAGARAISAEEADSILGAVVGLTFDVLIPAELILSSEHASGLKSSDTAVHIVYIGGEETLRLGALHKNGDRRYASLASKSGIFLLPEKRVSTIIGPLEGKD